MPEAPRPVNGNQGMNPGLLGPMQRFRLTSLAVLFPFFFVLREGQSQRRHSLWVAYR